MRRVVAILLVLGGCVPGAHPRDAAVANDEDAASLHAGTLLDAGALLDGGALLDAAALLDAGPSRAPLDFAGDVSFDDDATRAVDARGLPAGDAPCRAPALVWVEWTVDGDTLHVRDASTGATERVRIIGIDSPEIAHDGAPADCFGPEAATFTSSLAGHLVWLTFEGACFDRYGRTLAHVHLDAEPAGSWARQLLRRGLARRFSVSPNTAYQRLFATDERVAEAASIGLWGACP